MGSIVYYLGAHELKECTSNMTMSETSHHHQMLRPKTGGARKKLFVPKMKLLHSDHRHNNKVTVPGFERKAQGG